ncbi:uncharacterized protein VTP21DRAFT_4752 [Calcarisporiella thermophila]|uniref:uncharacterized protein n=1 Tax=Calcarisporiella thermophila TaxID=911321 RepID=UPI003743D494
MVSPRLQATSADDDSDSDGDNKHNVVETDPTGRFERYAESLGKGAYKEVYKAFDQEEGVEVAWNQLRVDHMNRKDAKKILAEIEILESLRNENIINFFASWISHDPDGRERVIFITELMTSGTLKQYIRKTKGQIKPKVLKSWCRQILRGLDYLHSREPPVIHRDLKCDNIFINGNNGQAKIGDLGLAVIKRKKHVSSVLGTPEFMAPELYEEHYDEKVDIYAFGMCVLEMVTKEYPYSECTNQAQIYRRVTTGQKPLSLHRVLDPYTREFIDLCLQHDPQRRPSARELLEHDFLKTDNNHAPLVVDPQAVSKSAVGSQSAHSSPLLGPSSSSMSAMPPPQSLPPATSPSFGSYPSSPHLGELSDPGTRQHSAFVYPERPPSAASQHGRDTAKHHTHPHPLPHTLSHPTHHQEARYGSGTWTSESYSSEIVSTSTAPPPEKGDLPDTMSSDEKSNTRNPPFPDALRLQHASLPSSTPNTQVQSTQQQPRKPHCMIKVALCDSADISSSEQIFLKMQVAGMGTGNQSIKFPFNMNEDTAESVVIEMVKEQLLSDIFQQEAVRKIEEVLQFVGAGLYRGDDGYFGGRSSSVASRGEGESWSSRGSISDGGRWDDGTRESLDSAEQFDREEHLSRHPDWAMKERPPSAQSFSRKTPPPLQRRPSSALDSYDMSMARASESEWSDHTHDDVMGMQSHSMLRSSSAQEITMENLAYAWPLQQADQREGYSRARDVDPKPSASSQALQSSPTASHRYQQPHVPPLQPVPTIGIMKPSPQTSHKISPNIPLHPSNPQPVNAHLRPPIRRRSERPRSHGRSSSLPDNLRDLSLLDSPESFTSLSQHKIDQNRDSPQPSSTSSLAHSPTKQNSRNRSASVSALAAAYEILTPPDTLQRMDNLRRLSLGEKEAIPRATAADELHAIYGTGDGRRLSMSRSASSQLEMHPFSHTFKPANGPDSHPHASTQSLPSRPTPPPPSPAKAKQAQLHTNAPTTREQPSSLSLGNKQISSSYYANAFYILENMKHSIHVLERRFAEVDRRLTQHPHGDDERSYRSRRKRRRRRRQRDNDNGSGSGFSDYGTEASDEDAFETEEGAEEDEAEEEDEEAAERREEKRECHQEVEALCVLANELRSLVMRRRRAASPMED